MTTYGLQIPNFTYGVPDAAMFEHVERTAGVTPQQILFFDDLAENVDAARRRGWRGHVIEVGRDPIEQLREHLHAEHVLE